jgi:hypothetical protein
MTWPYPGDPVAAELAARLYADVGAFFLQHRAPRPANLRDLHRARSNTG